MSHDSTVVPGDLEDPMDLEGLVAENRQVLDQLCRFLAGLSAAAYGRSLDRRQSLGKHVRHIIDHYEALLAATRHGRLDYEHRPRETWPERCPREAQRRLEAIAAALPALEDSGLLSLAYPLEEGGLRQLETSLGRELAFLTSHTIHHMALLGLLAERLGVVLSEDFGVHPSTLRHWASQASRASA
ncbi:DinB family protein [Halomonas salifodinae]|uniref:DinB family protein n=1 Tax=Halomonas salifodinae TaxID=438745 RepID=UPI0033B282A5